VQKCRRSEDFKLPFAEFADPEGTARAAFAAEVTPEAFVLDAQGVLRYRGRIDNAYAARLQKNSRVTHHDLRRALDDVLADKAVRVAATQAVGCPFPRPVAAKAAAGSVTFHRDVFPILQQHCQTCHRPGEVGPFSLMTYRQAVNWAQDIKAFTQSRKMPPWKPVAGPAFHGERKLTDREVATLAAWVDGDTPEGDPKDAPPPRRFPEGWQLGKPDFVLTVSDSFQVGGGGADLFRCFVLPTNLPADQYVTAVEVRPGNSRVVHHALLFLDTTGQGRRLERKEQGRAETEEGTDHGPGYTTKMGIGFVPSGGFGGWAPGQMPRVLPPGTGYPLPKGADVILQLHYHRTGRPEADRTTVGLYLAKQPIQKRFQSLVVRGPFLFRIPAGEERYRVEGSITVREDCEIYSVIPHMHMLGREIKVTMTPPGGPPQTLVAIADWDYNWQESYFFQQPIPVKSGTSFEIEAVYDNSARNPNNPNEPPRDVYFGEQTTDEMCFGFIGASSGKPGRIRVERN
jgi:mono/diheme cytochrome c family protein